MGAMVRVRNAEDRIHLWPYGVTLFNSGPYNSLSPLHRRFGKREDPPRTMTFKLALLEWRRQTGYEPRSTPFHPVAIEGSAFSRGTATD
jgi:hypothetical protein